MPWCPNCKTEYRAGFTVCGDCSAKLVEEAPPAGLPPKALLEIPQPCLLATVADHVELGMLLGLLEDAGIPAAVRDHHPAGSYLRSYMGALTYGQQVYVDTSQLEEARGLMEAYLARPDAAWQEPDTEPPEQESGKPLRAPSLRSFCFRRNVMRIGILLFLLPFAAALVGTFLQILFG
ncbi:hypothetical protein DWV16_05670 [Anaerotruncus sp. AF02-27]|jgi:hypothetical protein|uniref:putative signal transducing protein n=1 Tax=Anaerotruncus TaxID=244127 RepID=UPI000E4A03CA|nr:MULTISPECIES: DUF2007 domain-containing protein [Anaerotruncus]RGX56164.1 hypothetical protein DWV16_05670 [Anaerotruncus sp. AF02-27]